jgi:hypothetical protein
MYTNTDNTIGVLHRCSAAKGFSNLNKLAPGTMMPVLLLAAMIACLAGEDKVIHTYSFI